MKKTNFITTVISIIALSLILPMSAIAGEKDVVVTNEPLQVEVTNPPQQQLPFCPCFSSADIDEQWATVGLFSCVDDRRDLIGSGSIAETAIGILIEPDLIFGVHVTLDADDNLSRCVLLSSPSGELEVFYHDIGFDNYAACRLAIINSNTWANCP